jgi:translation initiation factor IF-3
MKGVMTTRDAQRLADSQGLDLVEISPNAQPPVCKIMDYGKFRYEESVKRKQARKNQKVSQIKEVKFHAGVDTNDLEHKLRQMHEFLNAGHKIKVTLQYRGRENAHRELGSDVIQRVIAACSDVAIVEQQPKLLGRVLGCLLAPKASLVGGGSAKPPASQPMGAPPPRPRPQVLGQPFADALGKMPPPPHENKGTTPQQ